MGGLELYATLWPSFPHFTRFVGDPRLAGVRLNSAQMSNTELEAELALVERLHPQMPLFFDVKARQMRVEEVHLNPDHLDITLNHPIEVATPVPVIFKAGADYAILDHLEEGGKRLIFRGGPNYMVVPGESLHIRHPSLKVRGALFSDVELAKIDKVRKAGFTRYFLSFVECQSDVDEFLELVGKDAEVWLKIENQKGLDFVANGFRKKPNLVLVAARGDLYVEIERPHEILPALKLIVEKDPEACVGSRILLSVCQPLLPDFKRELLAANGTTLDADVIAKMSEALMEPQVPSCADFCELAWLYDIGYRRMMLCDELCLRENLLATAVNAFDYFRKEYERPILPQPTSSWWPWGNKH